jgi:hypothetical protein
MRKATASFLSAAILFGSELHVQGTISSGEVVIYSLKRGDEETPLLTTLEVRLNLNFA